MTPDTLVTPLDLRDFAKSLGWELLPEALADRLYVLRNPAFPRRQLVFPMDMSAPDYAESIGLAFEKLGDILGIPPRSLLNRALAVNDDTLRFQVFDNHGTDHTLPLGAASSFGCGIWSTSRVVHSSYKKPPDGFSPTLFAACPTG